MRETKFIVGKLDPQSKKATMSLYSDINQWSAEDFISEMKWLESVGYEEIDILINSIGGSVVDGISIYSHITNSKVKCTTIIEGVAMSMGSIVWAAGDKLKMKDYGILMIHNPFNSSGSANDKDMQVTLDAFREQMKTIYMKRFGLDSQVVDKIMDGDDGVDGTYFNPNEAVEAGFIKESDIIKTDAIEKDKVLNSLSAFEGSKLEYAKILAKAIKNVSGNKKTEQPINIDNTIIDKITKTEGNQASNATQEKANKKNMENLSFIVASLGLPKDSDANAVVAKLTELGKANDSLTKEKDSLIEAKTALETEIAGHKTSIDNLKATLSEKDEKLKAYEAKEQAEKDKAILALVEGAIADGKITDEAKEDWISMAKTNLELTESTLNSIEAKKPVTEKITDDKEGVKNAEAGKANIESILSKKIESSDEFKAKMALLND